MARTGRGFANSADDTIGKQPSFPSRPQLSGGPDRFGYVWTDTEPFAWIDASTGTNVGVSPAIDHAGPIPLGFPFKHYEATYTETYVSLFGFIAFESDELTGAQQSKLPEATKPNSVIAAHWTALNEIKGYVKYRTGGVAPSRWFVVEWNRMSTDLGGEFTFEVVLHESGNIVLQYKTMTPGPGWNYCGRIGIEDPRGTDGLEAGRDCEAVNSYAVHLTRPPAGARVGLSELRGAAFVKSGLPTRIAMQIYNAGDLGIDVLNLTAISSTWSVSFDGGTDGSALTDTNSDGDVDTGPLARGQARTVYARFTTPAGTQIGDTAQESVRIVSSLSGSVSRTVDLQVAVPTAFAQAFVDTSNLAQSLEVVGKDAQVLRQVSSFCNEWMIASTHTGFVYGWGKGVTGGPFNIEYTLLDRSGGTFHPIAILADNFGVHTEYIQDSRPSFVTAPDGHIGIAWVRERFNLAFTQRNANIYFAVLNSSGELTYGPISLSGNNLWGGQNAPGVPLFLAPSLAATSDNHFVVTWRRDLPQTGGQIDDLAFAVRSSTGGLIRAATQWTSGTLGDSNFYDLPVVVALPNARALIAYGNGSNGLYEIVLNSSGTIVQTDTALTSPGNYAQLVDGVQLKNGNVLLAWDRGTLDYSFYYMIVSGSTYAALMGPASIANPTEDGLSYLSVAADSLGNGVVTWVNYYDRLIYYALLGSDGTILTDQMVFQEADENGIISSRGVGNSLATVPPLADIVVDHPIGAPGSYFIAMAHDFPANATATVSVNGNIISNTLSTDNDGNVRFILDTHQAEFGDYTIRVSVNPIAEARFRLEPDAPVWPLEQGSPILTIPPGIAYHLLFVPFISNILSGP